MGYDVHITRCDHWCDEDKPIGEAEWRNYVESDSQMQISGCAEVKLSFGSALRYENPLLAEWTGHPKHAVVWFDFRDGNVVVKNPDEATLEKMKAIARRLAARVQGDEGEFYD